MKLAAGSIAVLCAALGASLVSGADFATYRGFVFGMTPAAAAKKVSATAAEAKLVHQRPALIQSMAWRSRATDSADPVQDGLLYFFNGELSRIVVTYDRRRVEGMTPEDMIAGISKIYGPATKPTAEIAYHTLYGDTATVIARWEDADYSFNLVPTGDRLSFAMILYSKRLDALAQAASVEAVRLDKAEEPQRELAEQAKRDEARRLETDKARSVNKSNFRP